MRLGGRFGWGDRRIWLLALHRIGIGPLSFPCFPGATSIPKQTAPVPQKRAESHRVTLPNPNALWITWNIFGGSAVFLFTLRMYQYMPTSDRCCYCMSLKKKGRYFSSSHVNDLSKGIKSLHQCTVLLSVELSWKGSGRSLLLSAQSYPFKYGQFKATLQIKKAVWPNNCLPGWDLLNCWSPPLQIYSLAMGQHAATNVCLIKTFRMQPLCPNQRGRQRQTGCNANVKYDSKLYP